MAVFNRSLRDKLSQMRLPIADERHAATVVNRLLLGAETHQLRMARRLSPIMAEGNRSYDNWLVYLRQTLGECLVHEEALPGEAGRKEHMLLALDCSELQATRLQGDALSIPLNLILIDSAQPAQYDTLTFGYLDEQVLHQVVNQRHHTRLEEIVAELKPYLVELAQAFAEDELPHREQGLVLDARAFLQCEFNPHTNKVTLKDFRPSARWSAAQREILDVALQGRALDGRAAILASDYFNKVVAD